MLLWEDITSQAVTLWVLSLPTVSVKLFLLTHAKATVPTEKPEKKREHFYMKNRAERSSFKIG